MRERTRIGALRGLAFIAVAFLAALGTGCGSDDEARSEERPPAPINISVSLDEKGITASPAKFGAGPITLLIANQSRALSSGSAATASSDGTLLRRSTTSRPNWLASADARSRSSRMPVSTRYSPRRLPEPF